MSFVRIFNDSRSFSARLVDEMRGSRMQRQAQSRARAGSGNRTTDHHCLEVTTSRLNVLPRPKQGLQILVLDLFARASPEYSSIWGQADRRIEMHNSLVILKRREPMVTKSDGPWDIPQLYDRLDEFEVELREAGLKESSIDTYIGRSRFFVRWLDNDFHPRGATK